MGQEFTSSRVEGLLQERSGEDAREPELAVARMLAQVSQLLVGAEDVEATLTAVCRLAVEHIPGCEAAGVTLLTRGSLASMGATSDEVTALDQLQYQSGQGPCLDALRERDVVQTDDLAGDERWPRLGPAAVEATGVRSVLAFSLCAGERTLGSLNLYSFRTGAFRDEPITAGLGSLFASHAAVALAGAQTLEGLRAALESRETISVAMGILMAREGLSRAKAFDVLRRASQRENVKLREIAARIAGDSEAVLQSGG